jgi:hypothetical protein
MHRELYSTGIKRVTTGANSACTAVRILIGGKVVGHIKCCRGEGFLVLTTYRQTDGACQQMAPAAEV